jgi:hypothetical protein
VRPSWRDWRWRWNNGRRMDGSEKLAAFCLLCIVVAVLGYGSADWLSAETDEAQAVTSERLVTVVRKTPGGLTTEVETVTDTFTRPGEAVTESVLVTLTRAGETVVVSRPVRTVTTTIDGKVVTREVTDTVTRTNTVDRPTTTTVRETETRPGETVTGPGQTTTTTETRDVPGPERTTTETTTSTVTDTTTETETETQTETETETVTETVTEPPGPPN